MIRFAKTNKQSNFLRFDHTWHLEEFVGDVPQRSGPFTGRARAFIKGGTPSETIVDVSGFCKITHLLDAYRMIQGNYPMSQHPALPSPSRKSAKVYSKIHDPHNQAYVDAVACYMLSKFREADHSPHFSLFYGAYLAIAKEYYYNITEDFSDMRFEGWFWRKQKQGIFRLLGFEGDAPLSQDDALMEPPDNLPDDSSSCTDSDDDTADSVTDLHQEPLEPSDTTDAASMYSASIKTASTCGSESGSESESSSESSSESGSSLGKEMKFFAALSEFPTMLMFLESNTATMDSLLEEGALDCSPDEPEWEARWSAWLFQVIAALCPLQSLWAMTHNDLHSNNLLWTPTENEAGSQYNFGPLYDPKEPRVYPNPSFDLCRLSVSIFEAMFSEIPEDKEDAVPLSSERDRVQNETVSDLFNVLWSWLIDEDGRNVLWDADQSERYPGFDLYRIIAGKVKGAVPREQLDKAPFIRFAVEPSTVPEGEKVYYLFA